MERVLSKNREVQQRMLFLSGDENILYTFHFPRDFALQTRVYDGYIRP